MNQISIIESISLKKELLQYFFQLTDAEQQSVLNLIKTFTHSRNTEFKPITVDQYNRELEEADAEIEFGDFVTHEEVKKLFQKSNMVTLIKWNRKAIQQFKNTIEYIENLSSANAIKFQMDILNKIDELLFFLKSILLINIK